MFNVLLVYLPGEDFLLHSGNMAKQFIPTLSDFLCLNSCYVTIILITCPYAKYELLFVKVFPSRFYF